MPLLQRDCSFNGDMDGYGLQEGASRTASICWHICANVPSLSIMAMSNIESGYPTRPYLYWWVALVADLSPCIQVINWKTNESQIVSATFPNEDQKRDRTRSRRRLFQQQHHRKLSVRLVRAVYSTATDALD
jgi:hypothetical protein